MRRWIAIAIALMLSLTVVDARVSSGTLYDAGTVTAAGNSGWRKIPGVARSASGYEEAAFRLVPANLATTETLDVTIEFGYDSSGTGSETIVTFTQVTNTNVAETIQEADPMPAFYRVVWAVGPAPSFDFIVYYAVVN